MSIGGFPQGPRRGSAMQPPPPTMFSQQPPPQVPPPSAAPVVLTTPRPGGSTVVEISGQNEQDVVNTARRIIEERAGPAQAQQVEAVGGFGCGSMSLPSMFRRSKGPEHKTIFGKRSSIGGGYAPDSDGSST
jgi:hypothetical protein